MPVIRKYERDVDLLLAEEFEVSPIFATWFLSQIPRFKDANAKVINVAVSNSDYLGESDLIVAFQRLSEEKPFAVFIEDKIDAPFQPNQEIRYRQRATSGKDAGTYSDFQVVLCCPEAYSLSHQEAGLFDVQVSYETIAVFFESRGSDDPRNVYRSDFLRSAAKRGNITASHGIYGDPQTDELWSAAYDMASRDFPDLEMKPPRFTAGTTWVDFRPADFPTLPRVGVSLKGRRGFVDLTFSGAQSRLLSPAITPLIENGMQVVPTGNSAAIRLKCDGFTVAEEKNHALAKLRVAFTACVRLIRYYRQHRQELDKAAEAARPVPGFTLAC